MDDRTLRLELLRLVYRHDHASCVLIGRATELEAFVSGQAGEPAPAPAKADAAPAAPPADKRKPR